MPRKVTKTTIREIEPLATDTPVGHAARSVLEAELPALPVVDAEGKYAGIFGEREFLAALFPGYVGTLASARMISRNIDEVIERRLECRNEPVSKYLTTDHVLVEDDYSDTEIAEIFLHHRVLIVPIATEGRVHAVITRSDFFRILVDKLGEPDDEDVGS